MSHFARLYLSRPQFLQLNNLEKCLFQFQVKLSYKSTSKYERPITLVKRRALIKEKFIKDIKMTRARVEEYIERENIWTVPNFICLGRIIATPCLGGLIIHEEYQAALWLLGFAGLSDLADGWIARTWRSQASKLGSFLDPVADKLLVGTLFVSLTWVDLLPLSLTCLVIGRDVALIAAASYVRYKSLPEPRTLARYFDPTYATVQLAPTFISKLNTGVQLLLVGGTLASPVFDFVGHPFLEGLCYFTAFTTIAGGLSYLISKNTYRVLSKKHVKR